MQHAYKQFCERVDFEEDVLIPMIEAHLAGKAIPALGLKAGEAFEIVLGDSRANPDPPKASDTGE